MQPLWAFFCAVDIREAPDACGEDEQTKNPRIAQGFVNLAAGMKFRLETSPSVSLSNWSLLTPVTLAGPRFYYADTATSNQPLDFIGQCHTSPGRQRVMSGSHKKPECLH